MSAGQTRWLCVCVYFNIFSDTSESENPITQYLFFTKYYGIALKFNSVQTMLIKTLFLLHVSVSEISFLDDIGTKLILDIPNVKR